MHYTVSYLCLGRSPRHIVAYMGVAEVLILDGEQVNQLCAQVYSGLQIYCFNWSLNSFLLICNSSFISTNNNHKICYVLCHESVFKRSSCSYKY